MKKDVSYSQGYIDALADIVEECNRLLDKVPFNSEENKILDTIVFHTIDLLFKIENEEKANNEQR